jgi:hypothetical protein
MVPMSHRADRRSSDRWYQVLLFTDADLKLKEVSGRACPWPRRRLASLIRPGWDGHRQPSGRRRTRSTSISGIPGMSSRFTPHCGTHIDAPNTPAPAQHRDRPEHQPMVPYCAHPSSSPTSSRTRRRGASTRRRDWGGTRSAQNQRPKFKPPQRMPSSRPELRN